ncbi:MAG: hypothetical protein IJU28_05865 [Clostridia bacterium]|nr:hypothetical protein [Clostridia bacterium]
MSAFAIRKNNIGRALVRFLIGAIIIAALVIVINEFWLKKDTPAPESDLTAMETQNYDQAENPVSLAEALNEEENASATETAANPEATQDAALNETETNTADETQEEEGEFGEFEVIETVSEPTPTPTLVPTPTPEPTPTPIPASMYAARVTSTKVTKASWKTDKQSRINHGITEISTLPSENGGHVLSITGWSFGTYTIASSRGWDGKSNTTYLTVTNEKKQTTYYEVTVSAGATGIEHTTPYGKNMELADFVCNIDVSSYPDGTYTLGSANYFRITHNGQNNTMHHAYTFGDAYKFTVTGGYVTSIGGVENN